MNQDGKGLPTISSNKSHHEETVTFVVTVDNEGGEMVLDISTTHQLLNSSVAERNRQMPVDDTISSNALLTIPLPNNYCEVGNISSSPYSLHTPPPAEDLFPSNTLPEITHEPSKAADCTLNNEDIAQDQMVTIESTSAAEDNTQISYLTPVHIPNGPTLFVLESASPGGPSQVVAMSTKSTDLPKRKTKTRNLSILPKPCASSSHQTLTNSRLDLSSIQKPLKRRKQTDANKKRPTENNPNDLEVCILPSTSVISTPGSAATKTFICELCVDEPVHSFFKFVDLARHYLRVHQLRLLKQASAQCKEQDCSFKSWRAHDLRRHLRNVHSFPMDIQTLEFMSMKEFEDWKADEEIRSSSKFIRSSGNHHGNGRTRNQATVYVYYACQRSGNLRDRHSSGEPSKKSNRITSLKIDGLCTASISLIHDKQLNRVSCDYCSTHYGHNANSPTRQNLSKQEKEWIYQLLLRGWTSEEIVKTLRNAIITGTTDRMRRVIRQDIFNVGRSHGVRKLERKDADDDRSVKLWVQELQKMSCVVAWHRNDNTLLVVMSPDQLELIRQYGQVLHVAAFQIDVDRHYHLLTLAVPSTNGSKAYLVAYALTDCPSLMQAYQELFSAVQSKLGNFPPELKILSDDPSVLEEACLSEIVGSSTFLIPMWKVENDWNAGLLLHINDETKRYAVNKCLNTLLNESNPAHFAAFIELFNGMLAADGSLLSFSRFFFASYSTLATHWAGFHSLPDCTSLQKLVGELELVARRSRSIKRLDKVIYSLQYLAANQPFQPFMAFHGATDENSNLRHSISTQLKVLETSVHSCNNLETLKTIKRIVSQAAEMSTN